MGQIDDKQAQSFLRRAFEMGKENQLEYFAWLWVELTKHINREHLEPQKKAEEWVRVPKDVYDKMSWECTLAAIRRWDFVQVPLEPQQEDKKIELEDMWWIGWWPNYWDAMRRNIKRIAEYLNERD